MSQQEILNLKQAVSSKIIGQQGLIDRLLIAILADGHLLVEGAPGLAKTRAIKVLGEGVEGDFHRVQFTPDLLPADLTGTEIYRPQDGSFKFQRGPLFHNLILADEINRAPAKVQSALLEAMEESQVSIGDETLQLPDPFFVMATQNPVELEGTYPLPEAQIDRFLVKLVVPYPDADEEREIVARDAAPAARVDAVADADTVLALRAVVREVHVAPAVTDYAVRLVRATRDPFSVGARVEAVSGADADARPVALGASPRASIYLVRAARTRALLDGHRYTTPHDVKRAAPDVLRHRVVVTYEAEADGIGSEAVIDAVLGAVETP